MTRKIKDYASGGIKSRTIWFNAIVAGLLALEPVFGTLQAFVPGNVYAWCSAALIVGNAILRILTTQAILEK